VASSFCVSPLAWRPCWISLARSRLTVSWCSSSVSRSSFATFFAAECCLFWPAETDNDTITSHCSTHSDWPIDWVVALRLVRHKIGHFGDVSPSQSLGLVWKKTKPDTTKSTHSPIKRNVLQHKINTKKLKPGLVAFYDSWPGNGAGLFSKKNK